MKTGAILVAFLFSCGCSGCFHETSPDSGLDALEETDLNAEEAADSPVDETGPDPLDRVDFSVDRPGDGSAGEEEPDETPSAYSFVVFGDNQFAADSCTSGVPERMAVPEEIVELDPTFIIHTGDLVDHGAEAGAYDNFLSCYSEMLAAAPLFPTVGNHDADYSNGMENYRSYLEHQLFASNPAAYGDSYATEFQIIYGDDPTEYSTDFNNPSHLDIVPSGYSFKTFYAFRYENAYFISFEQGTRWRTCTPIPWVEEHLESARADPSIRHVFVNMHHPMYSTYMRENTDGECVEPVRRHYEDLFRLYDVTVVFSGHSHVYDRFHVPDDDGYTRARPPPDTYVQGGEGVHYIVTGGGGGPLPNGCDPVPDELEERSYNYSQARGCGYHVTYVQVDGEELRFTIMGIEGSPGAYTADVWDNFTIIQE